MTQYSDQFLIEKHKVSDLFAKLDDIYTQTKLTNGRVSELEKRSLGLWIHNHQTRTILFICALFSILISDIRHPVLGLVCKLLLP